MPTKKYKPRTPGLRSRSVLDYNDLTEVKPEKSLLLKKKKHSGRNNTGRITVRHQGGGHKQRYRIIDFKRDKDGIPGEIERLEYDPNRSSHIALVKYMDGERRYILAPKGIEVGTKIVSGDEAPIKLGNALTLKSIPVGTLVHNIEMKPGKGGQLIRSAGGTAQVAAREGAYVSIRLRSGETRKIHVDCKATIGEIGHGEHNLRKIGKAGAMRWRGVRPTVRGVAMNPVDHPHGGGEGRTSGGRHPVSPWGTPTKGYKTRSNKRTDNMIIRDRSRKRK